MPGCPPSDVAAYSKWVDENLSALTEYVQKNTTTNGYCNDAAAPKVNFDTVSKPVVETVQVPVDPIREIQELTKIIQKRQLAECRFITKQFLAKMKEHGCSGTSCRVKGKRLCSGKAVVTQARRRGGQSGGGCGGGMCNRP